MVNHCSRRKKQQSFCNPPAYDLPKIRADKITSNSSHPSNYIIQFCISQLDFRELFQQQQKYKGTYVRSRSFENSALSLQE